MRPLTALTYIYPDGPSDKTVAVVKFETLSGSPIAILVNYAVHGTGMGQENYEITAVSPGLHPAMSNNTTVIKWLCHGPVARLEISVQSTIVVPRNSMALWPLDACLGKRLSESQAQSRPPSCFNPWRTKNSDLSRTEVNSRAGSSKGIPISRFRSSRYSPLPLNDRQNHFSRSFG